MFLTGLIMTCLGAPISIGGLRVLYMLDSNPRARLRGGLTEESLFVVSIIGILLAVIGIILMIFGIVRRKNKALSDSIHNAGKLEYCPHCKTNVSSQNGVCPICKRKIGG